MIVERKSMFRDNICWSTEQRWPNPPPGLGTVEDDTREGKYRRSYRPHSKIKLTVFHNCHSIHPTTTKSGRAVRKPERFHQVLFLERSALKEGGSVGYGEMWLRTGDSRELLKSSSKLHWTFYEFKLRLFRLYKDHRCLNSIICEW